MKPTRQTIPIVVALILITAAYVFFVLTGPGQHFDLVAFEGRKATELGVRRATTFLMRWGTAPAVAVTCFLVAAMASRRGHVRLGIAAVLTVGLAVGLAEVLKSLLPRPELVNAPNVASQNTFPSGHATSVMATVLAWIWVSHRLGRRTNLAACTTVVVLWCTTMLGSGWHRPSDVLGGVALATAVVAGICVTTTTVCRTFFVAPDGPMAQDCNETEPGMSASMSIAVVAPVVVCLLVVAVIRNPFPDPRYSVLSFMAMVLIVGLCSAGLVALMWMETDGSRSAPEGS